MQLQGNELLTVFDNISNIVEKEIPMQGKNLADNTMNLEKVAQYCEDIYVNSKDQNKTHLLKETKGFTTQALASVAYQIQCLANSFLTLLDDQSSLIEDMGNSMTNLAHEVSIHKEKVARREIGVLTTNKCVIRTAKIKRSDIDEKPVKYVRKPIDYSIMDDIGHGVKLTKTAGNTGVGRQNSYSSTHSSSGIQNITGSGSIKGGQDTPPLHLKSNILANNPTGLNTVRSINSSQNQYYRTPIIPPSVPSEYLSRQELGIYSSKKELNQSGGADSLSAACGYGGPIGGYKKRPSINNSSMNMPIMGNQSYNTNVNEYSGTETLDSRMAQTYMQQLNLNPGMSNNNSVSYASGKDMNIIRTNLNNIDYTTTGTIYRRPQLNPQIYERATILPNQELSSPQISTHNNNNSRILSNPQPQHHQPRNNNMSNNQNNSSIMSNR